MDEERAAVRSNIMYWMRRNAIRCQVESRRTFSLLFIDDERIGRRNGSRIVVDLLWIAGMRVETRRVKRQ
jgi:hypothetical protein